MLGIRTCQQRANTDFDGVGHGDGEWVAQSSQPARSDYVMVQQRSSCRHVVHYSTPNARKRIKKKTVGMAWWLEQCSFSSKAPIYPLNASAPSSQPSTLSIYRHPDYLSSPNLSRDDIDTEYSGIQLTILPAN